VTKKRALCTSSVAYQGGRKPQFQINYDLVVRALPPTCSAVHRLPGTPAVLRPQMLNAVLWCAASCVCPWICLQRRARCF